MWVLDRGAWCDREMGVYDQGASDGQTEPVMGHPVFPPPVAFAQPLPAQGHGQGQGQRQGPEPEVDKGQWAATLCGCRGDLGLCCQTCWCPCVTFGQVAEIVDEGRTSCCEQAAVYALLCAVGIPCVYSSLWRQKLRRKFQLDSGSCCCCGGCCGRCEDFCVHCCCGACALCQEHRELQSRGLDPSLGWEAAAQRTYFRPTAVPTPPGVMLR